MKIKDLFNRKNNKNTISDYEGGNISGGNIYETHLSQNVRDEQMRTNAPANKEDNLNWESIQESLAQLNIDLWGKLTVNEWTLLKLNADYFINMIKFKANSNYLIRTIQKLIKCAYIYGTSAIYVRSILNSEPKLRVVVPMNVKFNTYGEPTSIDIIDFNETVLNNGYQTPDSLKPSETITDDLDNIIIFNWGINAIDSFQRMLPLVKFQSELLDMIVTASYGFIKKYDLIYNGKKNEFINLLRLHFSSKNPFNIKYGSIDLGSKISPIQNQHSENVNNYVTALIDFYKESTNIMYGLNGRRANQDVKKERNVTAEVEASQAQFDNLEYNIINEFDIFVRAFNDNEEVKRGGYYIEFSNISNTREDTTVISNNEPDNQRRDTNNNEDIE